MFKVFWQLIKIVFGFKNLFQVRYWFFVFKHSFSGEVTPFTMELPVQVNKVISAILERGYIPVIVGGSVRDLLYAGTRYAEPPKDFDIEVYGCEPGELISILQVFCKVDVFGERFVVIKLFIDGIDLDLSVPRIDNKVGKGKKGFATHLDNTMMPDLGSKRRDYTINSMMYDPRGFLLDFNHGVRDIGEGVLRATSPQLEEDPTRLYRGLQFATRKGLVPDKNTRNRLQTMLWEHSYINKKLSKFSYIQIQIQCPHSC